MLNFKTKIILIVSALIIAIIWLISPDKNSENKKAYFYEINLSISGIIKKTITTNEHDYGVIYLQNVNSNKSNGYESSFKDRYLFCKIDNSESIIVTPSISDLKPGDSVVINTTQSKYWIYKKGKLSSKINFWINDDNEFYGWLRDNKYLNFEYYRK